MPDIRRTDRFSVLDVIPYRNKKDFLRSAVNVLRRRGVHLNTGLSCTVRSAIPINAGTSSSSALVVGWVHLLLLLARRGGMIPRDEIASIAAEAEVTEFGGAGGMMDHLAASYGGVTAIDFDPVVSVRQLPVRLGPFVLGNSGESKDTQGILTRVKQPVLRIVQKLRDRRPGFSLLKMSSDDIPAVRAELDDGEIGLLRGTVRNHEMTQKARRLLSETNADHNAIGRLLTDHHAVLRDVQKISTPKIDGMLDAALQAGALGGKINGSGGGGCMFVYSPHNTQTVAEAIERAGGFAHIVHVDEGTRVDAFV
jgi:galactokinase